MKQRENLVLAETIFEATYHMTSKKPFIIKYKISYVCEIPRVMEAIKLEIKNRKSLEEN